MRRAEGARITIPTPRVKLFNLEPPETGGGAPGIVSFHLFLYIPEQGPADPSTCRYKAFNRAIILVGDDLEATSE